MFQLLHLEAQAQDQRLCAGDGIVGTGIGQVGIGLGKRHAVARCFSGLQLGLHFHQTGVAFQHELGG